MRFDRGFALLFNEVQQKQQKTILSPSSSSSSASHHFQRVSA
jgi:hypothetical protein